MPKPVRSSLPAPAQEWLDLLGDTNVPMMVVNSLDDLVHDPHLEATGFWKVVEHPDEGSIRMSSPPMNFSETPASIRSLAPRLGQHSVEILREAGLQEELIQQMLAAGETRVAANNCQE